MRQIKTESKVHRFRAIDDCKDGEIVLVSGKKQAYLWVKVNAEHGVVTFTGAATLRKLAKAILQEVGQ